MPSRFLPTLLAYLLSFFVADIGIHFIDIFGFAIPRYVHGISIFFWVPIVVIVVLWGPLRARNCHLIEPIDIIVSCLFMLYAVVEYYHGNVDGKSNYNLILSLIPAYLTYLAARYYINIFSSEFLIESFLKVSAVVTVIHLILLIFIKQGVSLPTIVSHEVVSRNSISLLMIVSLGLLFVNQPWSFKRYKFIALLFIISLCHVYFNGARAGAVALLIMGVSIAICYMFDNTYFCKNMIILLCFMVVLATSFGCEILDLLGYLNNGTYYMTDNMLSVISRVESNRMLIGGIADSMLFGVGYNEVVNIKSHGYMSHTLYLIVFAAYGLLGIIPLLYLLYIYIKKVKVYGRVNVFISMPIIAVAASFFNDMFCWYGFVFAVLSDCRDHDNRWVGNADE